MKRVLYARHTITSLSAGAITTCVGQLVYASADTDAAQWVPASVLLWALGAMVGAVALVLGIVVSMFKREVSKLDRTLERFDQRLLTLEKSAADGASRLMLSSFGDRFEGHLERVIDRLITVDKDMSSKIAGMAVQFAGIEARLDAMEARRS